MNKCDTTGSQQVWYCTKYLLFFKPRSLTKLTLNSFISAKPSMCRWSSGREVTFHFFAIVMNFQTSQNISFQIIASRNIILKSLISLFRIMLYSKNNLKTSILKSLLRIIKFSNHYLNCSNHCLNYLES